METTCRSPRFLARWTPRARPALCSFGVLLVALASYSCEADSGGTGPDQPDVSGVWRATLDGTVYHNEDGTGQTTTLTLTLTQSGSQVTGTERFDDTRGRSATIVISGTIAGDALTFTGPDPDPQCEQRIFASSTTLHGTTSGSSMTVHSTAPKTARCHALDSSLTYTKQ